MNAVDRASLRAHAPIEGSMAWRAGDLREADWRFALPADALAELRVALDRFARYPVPLAAFDAKAIDAPAAKAFMADVTRALRGGRGFALVGGLPIDKWGTEPATAAYWLLSSMIARPVAQKLDGTLVYDVHDTGRKAEPGSGVRPDKTNIEQYFHNDNAYSRTQPDFVGLLCLRPALEGGVSGVASAHTIHNAMRDRAPELLDRLYQNFRFDRQDGRFAHEAPTLEAPLFTFEGRLRARFGLYPLFNAYKLGGAQLDERGEAALALLKDVLREESLCHTFTMSRGDIQFVNNLETCHRRTAFVDDPAHPRHLVRLWLRDAGWRGYEG
jgi:hypothetical protein